MQNDSFQIMHIRPQAAKNIQSLLRLNKFDAVRTFITVYS